MNVDLEVARQRGIGVTNLVAYCTASVVEHVFAVLLHLARNIGRYETLVRTGEWQRALLLRTWCGAGVTSGSTTSSPLDRT